eukprot:TRINITY_DN11730_c0_g1_i1.p1 TRINITY_DN11730_c0_g1~~TRINITY_DN11730_c0_g1_i1.p1  ORF type:complete len:165 (-),score=20.77 TRINITY_DN11730_c0_g1_i1:255-749(-)
MSPGPHLVVRGVTHMINPCKVLVLFGAMEGVLAQLAVSSLPDGTRIASQTSLASLGAIQLSQLPRWPSSGGIEQVSFASRRLAAAAAETETETEREVRVPMNIRLAAFIGTISFCPCCSCIIFAVCWRCNASWRMAFSKPKARKKLESNPINEAAIGDDADNQA